MGRSDETAALATSEATTSEPETRRVAVASSRKLCQSPAIQIHRYLASPDQRGASPAMFSLVARVIA